MISTFGSTYFGNQYITRTPSTVDLGEVTEGSTHTIEFYNAADVAVSAAIYFPLEDGTFELSWPGQTVLTSASDLVANPLTIPAHDSTDVTLDFRRASRESAQGVDISWAGASQFLDFTRLIRVGNKPQGNVQETIEFKTDVSEAWDGTEQRARIRVNPRSTVSQEYLFSSNDRSEGRKLQAEVMGMGSRQASLALWHRSQAVIFSSFNGSSVNINRDASTPWDPALVALKRQDIIFLENSDGTIVAGKMFADFSQGLANVVELVVPQAITPTGRVIPAARATMQEGASTGVYSSDATSFRTTWVHDSPDYVGNELDTSGSYLDLAPEKFLDRPILREGNLVNGSLEFSSDSGAVRFDKKLGTIETFHRRESSVISFDRTFEYTYEESKIEALRQFIHWTQGRQRSFYVASGTEDLFVTSVDDSQKTLTVMGAALGGIAPLLDGTSAIEVTYPGAYEGHFYEDFTTHATNPRSAGTPNVYVTKGTAGNTLPGSTVAITLADGSIFNTTIIRSYSGPLTPDYDIFYLREPFTGSMNAGAQLDVSPSVVTVTSSAQSPGDFSVEIPNNVSLIIVPGSQVSITLNNGSVFTTTVASTDNESSTSTDTLYLTHGFPSGVSSASHLVMNVQGTILNEDRAAYEIVDSSFDASTDTATLTYSGSIGSVPSRVEILYHVRLSSDKIKLKYDGRESVSCKFKVQTVKQ